MNVQTKKRTKGFTLIELLIVIAIIGVLSSIVITSLNSARSRAKDVSIKTTVLEFRKLMELEYLDNQSYANLNKGWVGTSPNVSCTARGYAGNYASEAIKICEKIRSYINPPTVNDFYTGNSVSNSTHYSIMARLSSNLFFGVGSSGRNSNTCEVADGWSDPGCYANP